MIVAEAIVRHIEAARSWIAGVLGAGTLVIAGRIIGMVDTLPGAGIANIKRAGDTVVRARERRSTRACTICASIVGCAGIAIIAQTVIGIMGAGTRGRIARIVGTGIAVVAVRRVMGDHTRGRIAGIDRASIVIVYGHRTVYTPRARIA